MITQDEINEALAPFIGALATEDTVAAMGAALGKVVDRHMTAPNWRDYVKAEVTATPEGMSITLQPTTTEGETMLMEMYNGKPLITVESTGIEIGPSTDHG